MLIQDISEDIQPPSLRSCAGNFPGKEFPWEMTGAGWLAPARMEMLWEQQIPNAGSTNSASGLSLQSAFIPVDTQTQERMPRPPADFMPHKHIHKIRLPERYDENYESLH